MNSVTQVAVPHAESISEHARVAGRASLDDVTGWLVRHRRALSVGYGVLMTALYAVVFVNGLDGIPNAVAGLTTGRFADDHWIDVFDGSGRRLALIAAYALFQALFVWGVTRSTPARRHFWALGVTGGLVATALSYVVLLLASELALALHGHDDRVFSLKLFLPIVAVAWASYAVAIRVHCGRRGNRGIAEVVAALVGVGWVELAIALGLDAAVRHQRETAIYYTGSWLAVILCVPAVLWALGPALVMLFRCRRDFAASMSRSGEADSVADASNHVSSARGLSIVLFTVSLIAYQIAQSSHHDVETLADAQQKLVLNLASQALAHPPPGGHREIDTPIGKITIELPAPVAEPVVAVQQRLINATPDPTELTQVDIGFKSDSRRWLRHVRIPADSALGKTSLESLESTARSLGLKKSDYIDRNCTADSVDDVGNAACYPAIAAYVALEPKLFARTVKVPGFDFELGPEVGIWALAGLVVLFLVMIRSGIRAAVTTADGAVSEPWLLVDGRRGLEKLIAEAWLWALLAAPIVVCVLLVVTTQDKLRAIGAPPVGPQSIGQVVGLFWMVGSGTWMGTTLWGDVLALRVRRASCVVKRDDPASAA